MPEQIDTKSLKRWEKGIVSLDNYQNYLSKHKFHLTLIDLLYVSNFKGGNATINEDEEGINKKLKSYSDVLLQIDQDFKNESLANLSGNKLEKLIDLSDQFFKLAKTQKIDGFSYSFMSTLLHAYFPKLYPILDRRILLNLEIIKEPSNGKSDVWGDGQIKDIYKFYPKLIRKVREECQVSETTVRGADKKWFSQKLPKWYNDFSERKKIGKNQNENKTVQAK